MNYTVLWSATSNNRKTGNIPQGTIGTTKEEILHSCNVAQCKLRPVDQGGNGECYAHHGTPAMAASSKTRALARGKNYTLDNALPNSARSARFLRLADIGDPVVLTREQVTSYRDKAIAAGMQGIISYSHAWKHAGQHLKGLVMASCDTLEEADEAIEAGWRAAVILPHDAPLHGNTTPAGRRIVVCPAQRLPNIVTCNICGACDASTKGPIIGCLLYTSPSPRD